MNKFDYEPIDGDSFIVTLVEEDVRLGVVTKKSYIPEWRGLYAWKIKSNFMYSRDEVADWMYGLYMTRQV